MVKTCAEPAGGAAFDVTLIAVPVQRPPTPRTEMGRDTQPSEDWVSMQIGFRRALTVGCAMWASFFVLDAAVVHYLHAGTLSHFLAARAAVETLLVPVGPNVPLLVVRQRAL